MRIYVPPDTGLGAHEVAALRRLSRPSLAIIADELTEPGSRDAIRWVLRQRDPERALAEVLAENVRHATDEALYGPDAGMGELGKKSFLKKVMKFHRKVAKVVKKVHVKLSSYEPIYNATKKIRKKVMNVARKYLPLALTVLGFVLAVIPGGAPFALAVAAVNMANELRKKKIEADKAKHAGKAQANAMQAEVDAMSDDVNKQCDDVWNANQNIFVPAGYTADVWNALTIDEKSELIQNAVDGKLKPTAAALAAQNDALAQVDADVKAAADKAAADMVKDKDSTSGSTHGPSGGASSTSSGSSWTNQGVTPDPNSSSPSQPDRRGQLNVGREGSAGGAPPSGESTPSAQYVVSLEGQPMISFETIEKATAYIQANAKVGDRFEIVANGQPSGLKVLTDSGAISIPPDQESAVRSMSHGEVVSMISSAKDEATKTDSSGGGNGLLWLLGAAAAATVAMKGK